MNSEIFEEVKSIVIGVLQLDAAHPTVVSIDSHSGLMGDRPEFDSMAVVQLLTALEEFYGFMVEDDEIDAEIFATFGDLCQFVEGKLSA